MNSPRSPVLPALALAVLLVSAVLGACTGLSRDVNQALPEFLRSEPGEEEMVIFQKVRSARDYSPEDLAAQNAQVDAIAALKNEGNWSEAIDRIEDFLEQYPVSRHDAKVRFWLGQCHYEDDSWGRAFPAWRELSVLHPVSDYNASLIETLYYMGKEYLAGNRSSFFGIFSRRSEGERVLNHLIETFPSSARAADAQWLLARYNLEEEQWAKAAASFQFLVDQYSNSEWYEPGLYCLAYSQYRQVKGAAYDPAMMKRAKEAFDLYLSKATSGLWREEASLIRGELEELQAAHVLTIAEWYLDQGKPYSARYYLVNVTTRFPLSVAAARAREIMPSVAAVTEGEEIPAAEAELAPPPGGPNP
jgi:outer membrane protein assembly factor BamD (BamD/ComL family)